jgi:hypothetical protein
LQIAWIGFRKDRVATVFLSVQTFSPMSAIGPKQT